MKIVGMISGTSMDGIDAALCEIDGAPPQIRARILHAAPYPFPPGFPQRIMDVCVPGQTGTDVICELNADLGELFASAALNVIRAAGLTPADVDLVASHGQTVWHMIQPDGRASSTLQLAEPAIIAERTGITTVANFRPRDLAAGGQGAPLASYLDWLLLRDPVRWRAVQNIGGIGNVTFLPPLSDSTSAPLAFDTGPGNLLIDAAVRLITDGAQGYDRDGLIAVQGQVDEVWLADLLQNPYYDRQPPKTTGRELFSAAMGADLLAQGRGRGLDDADIVATLTALTAATIADAYKRFSPAPVEEAIVGGGGARNPTLVQLLRERSGLPVLTHDEIGIDSDNKEALLFALLGHETWYARPGTHPALTGARHGSVLGQIVPGANYRDLIRATWCG